MFKDCFGKVLKDGDDVIVSIDNVLYDGIVLKELNDLIIISYHYWKHRGEIEHDLQYTSSNLVDGKLLNVYKI